MKKVLENDLISLAHRILKLRGKANVEQLKEEAGMLYEKLVLLDFADKHFDGLQPTIGKEKFKQTIADQFEVERDHERYPDGTEYNPEAISEPNTEKIKDIVSQMPPESEEVDGLVESSEHTTDQESTKKTDSIYGVSFDDLPDFEPAEKPSDKKSKEQEDKKAADNDVEKEESKSQKNTEKQEHKESKKTSSGKLKDTDTRKKSLNNKLVKDLKLGLNNRIAFTKHLFDGNKDALNDSIQNINNCKNFKEAKLFIEQDVKPRYDNWKGKEEYEERFFSLIENKFLE